MVEHGEPLLLIGADLLQGGRPLHSWNWLSISARTEDVGKVQGFMTFVKGSEGGEEEEVKLLNAPAGLSERKQGMNEQPHK